MPPQRLIETSGRRVKDPRDEPIELRLGCLFHLRARPVGRQPIPNQRIDQNLEEAPGGLAGDRGISGDIGYVRTLPGRKRSDFEKAAETAEIPDQSLGFDLLA